MLEPVTKLFNEHYVYGVELLVILAIVIFLLYVLHTLGVLKKTK